MKAEIITLENKAAGNIELPDAVFGVDVRKDILARMVNFQRAKKRAGTHKVKTRGEIRGTTAKPFRQKGSGRARQGSIKVVQMRGGATVFGPVVRDHGHKLTKKLRKLALRSALSAKQADGKLIILDDAELKEGKTKLLAAKFAKLNWGRVLIVGASPVNENFVRAARNIPNVDVLPTEGANVYDILRRDTLVLTKAAVDGLGARLL
ncbi:MAG: 50S ribosomal protein L4 [Rhodospirillaceae bacterium]|nr:50S ribosomal protein L4 [Rhodospirillaceae bacterium]|tara:strand:+ start:2313 stop:2933 length:621 start_codon:yes stop_codon:yes gene_type:complete